MKEFTEELFKILDSHYIGQMRLRLQSGDESEFNPNERIYQDGEFLMTHFTIIFSVNDKYEHVRILIRDWQTSKSFSKNVPIDEFDISKPELVIEKIKMTVRNFSGKESRDFLDEWYSRKKVEIRDSKLEDLGL